MQYTSKKFQLHYLSSYSLLIKAGDIQDVLLVLDNQNEIINAVSYEADQPSETVKKLLSLPFVKVYVSLPHESMVLIPTDVYSSENNFQYSKYLQHGSTGYNTSSLDALNVTAIYQYDILKVNKWRSLFPDVTFVPEFSVLLEQAQPHIPIRGKIIGLHFNDDRIDIFLFIHGEFILYNNFEVLNQDDLMFYLLQVYKNFDLGNRVDKILLSGIHENHAYINSLHPYAESLEFLKNRHTIAIEDAVVNEELKSHNILLDSAL